jgi:hypothetical protein
MLSSLVSSNCKFIIISEFVREVVEYNEKSDS